jgi:hypothetical protein
MTTVTITKSDIENGIRRSCRRCPAALALDRTFPQFRFWLCETNFVVLPADAESGDPALGLFRCPPELSKFIHDFDNQGDGAPPEPISFSVDLSGIPHQNS